MSFIYVDTIELIKMSYFDTINPKNTPLFPSGWHEKCNIQPNENNEQREQGSKSKI